jgi:pimeloyl-ACP methyl ester carboxylesterase
VIYWLFSHAWSGLVVAAFVFGVGALIVFGAKRFETRWLRWFRFLGYGVYGLAALASVGAVVAIFRINALEHRYDPPGRLVDVGGYRLHILAEGEARGQSTVVWIPGAHGQGLLFHHLHEEMRTHTRSILFDRAGTGWSDVGPYPRRTRREVEDLVALLRNAGEEGPFILVGHSFGGLLAANFARRHPEQVSALILLDATPPDQVYGNFTGADGFASQVTTSELLGLSKTLGFQIDLYGEMAKHNELMAEMLRPIYAELDEVMPKIRANEASPASDMAAASIFREFAPTHFRRWAMETVVYDGELGDLPVTVVIPQHDFDEVIHLIDLPDADRRRLLSFVEHTRLRYLQTSSRSELVYAPEGSTHNFPYEHPDFVLGLVQGALAAGGRSSPASPQAQHEAQ